MTLRVVGDSDKVTEAAPDEVLDEALVAMRKLERTMLADQFNETGHFRSHQYSAVAAATGLLERMARG